MNFELNKSIELLERTPAAYKALFYGLSSEWGIINEGDKTWSAFDIIGHLIHGEKTDWIPRARIILSKLNDKTFEPFDRFAQEEISKGKTLEMLIDEFTARRTENLKIVKSWNLTKEDLEKTGVHPHLGPVTLKQLIAAWTIHDMSHLHQVSRVVVKYYKNDAGPFAQYIRILKED